MFDNHINAYKAYQNKKKRQQKEKLVNFLDNSNTPPATWQQVYDANNNLSYYYNMETGECAWNV